MNKRPQELAQEATLWLILIVLVLVLTGCSTLRELTMTEEERRLYGKLSYRQCLDPTVVCIKE
jgi:uncharacterized protein YceK